MIPVAELKTHLRVTHTTDDEYIEGLERAAVSLVEEYEGAFYGERDDVTRYLPGTGTTDLWLPETPNTVVTVHEASYPGDEATEVIAADDDGFLVRGSRLVRKGGYTWPRGYEYTVVYNRGFTEGLEPERVHQAVRLMVARWYSNRTGLTEAGRLQMDDEAMKLLRRRAPRVG